MTDASGPRPGPGAVDRLARLTGEPADELRRWVGDELLARDEAERATAKAVAQVRLVQVLRRRGFDVDDVIRAARSQPELFDRYLAHVARPAGELHTLDEAARIYGLDPAVVRKLWEASGLADQGEIVTDEDVEALAAIAVALGAGIPEEALVQLLRVYADSLSRIAEAETRMFHSHVHERLRGDGAHGADLVAGTDSAIEQLQPLAEPGLIFFHRKALARAVSEDVALHLAEDAGLIRPGDTSGRMDLAVAFVDLARFTSMTEAMGDLVAARVLDQFSELTRRAVMKAGGRVVKQIGDEFMLVFADAPAAVRAALDIRAEAARQPAFLATRLGVHCGPVLCREGDYVGRTVNVAARITAQAAPHQLLVSDQVRAEAAELDVGFASVGRRLLKGLDDEIDLFEVTPRTEAPPSERFVDPVCGMVLEASTVAARLTLDGTEYAFCSEHCLQRLTADPDRYR